MRSPFGPPTVTPKASLIAVFILLILLVSMAAFPMLIFLVDKSQTKDGFPDGLRCSSCYELCKQNIDLCKAEDSGCWRVKGSSMPNGEKDMILLKGIQTCWLTSPNHDEWGHQKSSADDATAVW